MTEWIKIYCTGIFVFLKINSRSADSRIRSVLFGKNINENTNKMEILPIM